MMSIPKGLIAFICKDCGARFPILDRSHGHKCKPRPQDALDRTAAERLTAEIEHSEALRAEVLELKLRIAKLTRKAVP